MIYSTPTTLGQRLAPDTIIGFLWLHSERFYKTLKHRRDVAVLLDHDDRLLADIGLTHGDVRRAIRQPLWRDPTEMLRRRASAQPWRQGQAIRPAGEAAGAGAALAVRRTRG